MDSDYLFSNVFISLDGRDWTEEPVKFYYYPELKITNVERNTGPTEGGTLSKIYGKGFTHKNVCNLVLKYGVFEVKPLSVSADSVTCLSPKVLVPGSITIFPSGNGQNFAPDYTIHFRDEQNTFTYTQAMFVEDVTPNSGPSSGGTKLVVRGWGF